MTLKTFNIDEEVYKEFSKHCKENGISMSKRVENFIRSEIMRIGVKKDLFKRRKSESKESSFSRYC